jgi:photosystem II stability/assembly factor-like uncharacterized protein
LSLSVALLVGAVSADAQASGRRRSATSRHQQTPAPRKRARKSCVPRQRTVRGKRPQRGCNAGQKARGGAPIKTTGTASPPKASTPVSPSTFSPASSTGLQAPGAALTASSGASLSGSSGWVSLGEPGVGGRVSGLAVSPANSGEMLVGGDMLGVGLSVDGGESWAATSGFSSWEINAFTWETSSPQVVWVGTLSGPYESVDGGHTWSSMRTGMPAGDYPYSAPVQKVLVDSSNPQHLVAFGGNQSQFKAGGSGALNYGLVYESTDGGQHWSTIANIGTNWNILDAVGSSDLQTLYAAVLNHGVYKSSDGGQTWTAVDNGLPNDAAMALAQTPSNPNTVWLAVGHDPTPTNGVYGPGGIYETTDGANSWTAENTGIQRQASSQASSATSMASILLAGDGTLYTADQGLANQYRYKSTDGGQHWTIAGGTFPKFYSAAATPYAWASSADGSVVIGGSSDTLMASTDHGATWHDIGSTQTTTGGWHGNGYSGLLGTRIAFSPTQPGDIFLTGFDAGNLLRSTDSGTTWTRPLAGWDNYDGGYDVQAGGQNGNIIYSVLGQAGTFNGIAISQDNGQTWTYHVGGALPARYAVGSGQGSIAIASADGSTAYAVLPNDQVYVTTDTGDTWTAVSLASPAFAVASSPDHRNTYIATNAGIYQITSAGGMPALINGSPTGLRRLVVAAEGAVYGAGPIESSQSGLWTNQSGSWTRLSSNQWVNDVAIDPTDPTHIAYVTNDNPYHDTSFATGVWISCDAGQTFTQDNAGLPMLRVLSVAFDPWTPGRLIVGTNGRGYWQTELPSCS